MSTGRRLVRHPDMGNSRDFREFLVDCRGRPAIARVGGAGPNVVVIGAAAPRQWTEPVTRALRAAGLRALDFDYGPPDGWEGEPVARTALDQVEDVVDVLRAADMQKAHAIGVSRGAITASGLAARRPGMVDRLVLAFPVAGSAEIVALADSGPRPLDAEGPTDFVDRAILPMLFSPEYLASNRRVAKDLVLAPQGTVVRVDRQDEEPFHTDDQIDQVTLVLEAELDSVVRSEHPGYYVNTIPDCEHRLVPDARHGWLMERPADFASIAAGFLT